MVCLALGAFTQAWASAPMFHGSTYQHQSAAGSIPSHLSTMLIAISRVGGTEKQKQLWSALAANHDSNPWPNTLEVVELFFESMNLTFAAGTLGPSLSYLAARRGYM